MFDFFTLYMNMPHHKLKSVVEEFVNFFLNDADKEFIGIIRYCTIWTKSREKHIFAFYKTSLKLEFLQGLIEPLLCQTFLYYYERKQLFQNRKTRPVKGSCISNIYWFRVDQFTFNNDEFENNCNNVNLHAVELKKEADDPCKLSFFGHFTRGT